MRRTGLHLVYYLYVQNIYYIYTDYYICHTHTHTHIHTHTHTHMHARTHARAHAHAHAHIHTHIYTYNIYTVFTHI